MKWFTLRPPKGLLWAAGAAAAVGIGVLFGSIVSLRPSGPTGDGAVALDEVILGTPGTPPTDNAPWQPGDPLAQKRTYETGQFLALRVVSRESKERQIPLTARLLHDDGSLTPLSPSTITVTGGTGGFCCWQIDTPGKYKLQIFAPEQAPIVVPLTIVAARQNQSPLRLQ